jgi:molybdopterin/thiamine biosynthesis adenylyltransferase
LRHEPSSDRYLVTDIDFAEGSDQLSATPTEFSFAPQFLTRTTRSAHERGLHLALIHSHPAAFTAFSSVDNEAEAGLSDFMHERLKGAATFSVLVCGQEVRARQLGTRRLVSVVSVGAQLVRYTQHEDVGATAERRYDRQVRAFGVDGQRILQQLTVAVVGLGGTGSVLTQQLSHLGIGSFVLIDPDDFEITNLNRVVGASSADVSKAKVDIAASLVARINPKALVQCARANVVSHPCAELLRGVDCIFICTDSHVSRAFLSEFSYQYLVPSFDVGVAINAKDGKVDAITGRTQMLAPGLACLLCAHALDPRLIRQELMTPEQRAADPYFNTQEGVHEPAVISLNSAMVSLTVTMFLSAFLGIPGRARWQSYDGIAGTVRVLASKPDPECSVCGVGGVTALAGSRPLSFLGSDG